MYLATALKIAIPYAILDREDMARVYGYEGPEAAEADKACSDLKALQGIPPAKFTAEQRECARLALVWGEQYLVGYIDALGDSDKAELELSRKQRRQIRKVRFHHYGKTQGEILTESSELVDIREAIDVVRSMRN